MFAQGRWGGRYYHFEVPKPIKIFNSMSPENRHEWVKENREAFVSALGENPEEVSRDDLSALPFDVLLEIVKHPGFVIEEDPVPNEIACLDLFQNKIESFSETERWTRFREILEAVHLPVIFKEYNLIDELCYQKSKKPISSHPVLDHIYGHYSWRMISPELFDAGDDPQETREWYLERYRYGAALQISLWHVPWTFGFRYIGRGLAYKHY